MPLWVAALLVTACLVLASCGSAAASRSAGSESTCRGKLSGVSYITVWFHASASVGAEWQTMVAQAAQFNRSQRQVRVRLITLPEGDYEQEVASAAASGNLPDVLDFDGPNLYNYAWAGDLKPLDSCLTARQVADLLPSIRRQGTYDGRMWGWAHSIRGWGLYVRPSILRKAGISIPTSPARAWTAAQLTGILARARAVGYRQPLDLQISYDSEAPEWNTYGFAPAVWSAGGDLIDRAGYRRVDGFLNGAPAVKALTTIQGWAKAGYINPNRDGMAFEEGKTPISWVGHWLFDAYTKAFPGDVQIVPLPRFGPRDVTDLGSWQWGITANAPNGDAAWRFISFLLRPHQVLQMTDPDGAVPGTYSAIRLSPRFAPGGPEHLYVEQLESGVAKPRPQTAAYPALTAAFAGAFQSIVVGLKPVRPTLDAAARAVTSDLIAHDYYAATR
ncbi:MAG: extracellular solute-binding protein [Solirubrobacterales bacterium]|nr:extracellular solute-binding protein [Solirubrobacterales bacterium]